MTRPTDAKMRELMVPKLKPQPTLLQVLDMEQGRLAQWTFGRPTDSVFYVERHSLKEPSDV